MLNREEQSLLGGVQQRNVVSIQNPKDAEKLPFLTEPVRLTPAWEERNLPNNELNFEGLTMERSQMELSPPKDKYLLVFFTLVLHGVGTLMPWNMFITAKSYFTLYKLASTTSLAKNFMPYIGFASQIPNVLFNWLNIFVPMGGNLTIRIIISLFIEVIIFIITVALAMSDTSGWPEVFFWITMATVVILNMAGGVYQNTVYGMAAKLPLKYTGAVVLGSNISGTFTSIINIISTRFASSVRTAAIYYFITAMLVLLLCFDTYFALPLNKFYRYHEMVAEKEAQKQAILYRNSMVHNVRKMSYGQIFIKAAPQLFNIYFVFFITLAIFPTVHSDIKRFDNDFIIPEDLYMGVVCFLTFNLTAMLGSLLANFVQWPSSKYLVIPVALRALFLPLFLFCNYQPLDSNRIMPVYITNDWVYWFLAIIMGLSSGYLSSLGMMYAPRTVEPQYSSTAGMFAAAMLITGIFSGILFSMIFPIIVTIISW